MEEFDGRSTTRKFSPWKRNRAESVPGCYTITMGTFFEKFDQYIYRNMDLSIEVKRIALKVSPSVVSLVSLSDGMAFFMSSGTIIQCESVDNIFFSTILTSASILRLSTESDDIPNDIKIDVHLSDGRLLDGEVYMYDFHYNIAAIKVKSEAPLPTATLRFVDDSISINPIESHKERGKAVDLGSSHLRPHSDFYNLCAGESVVAFGRYFEKPRDLMAAPGVFSLDCCKLDCKELFRADCEITKCGIGGPLVNRNGEVIGLNFYNHNYTPFLPINIASKCLEHFMNHGRICRPYLGMAVTNLYATSLEKLDKIINRFPTIFKGVIVEEVVPGSPAERAGILRDDVIVQCNESPVQSLLQFIGLGMDNTGQTVELVVVRGTTGTRENHKIFVSDTIPDHFYSWPVPGCREKIVDRYREDLE